MRGADEHFDEIVVEGVVELALELPGELRTFQIAGMNLENVGMYRDCRVLQVNQNLDDSIGFPGGESEQRMIVEAQVIADFGELWRVGHGIIVDG